MNTALLDQYIEIQKLDELNALALRKFAEAYYLEGKKDAVEECQKIIKGEAA